jgi:hypothetical protein
MTFGLKWRAKWWLRRQVLCRFHHCQGKQIESDMGLGWQCATCGRIAHWVKWTAKAEQELLTEQPFMSIPQRSLASVPSSPPPQ